MPACTLLTGHVLDTSEQSKQNSANMIEELGGEANHYGKEDQPHSKNAAEVLEGSRAM